MDDKDVIRLCFDRAGRRLGGKMLERLFVKMPELKEYILKRYGDSESIEESVTRILRGIEKKPACKMCGKPLKFNKSIPFGFRTYCSLKCQNSDPDKIALTAKIKLDRYGDAKYNNPEKSKQTCLQKYGVEYVTQTDKFKEKSKQACLEKYGVEFCLQAGEVIEKSKKTCIKKYGVDNCMKNEKIKEKSRQTCFKHFGVYNSKQSELVKQKEKEACLERYGVTSYRKTKECEEKIRNTIRKKYGVDHVTKSKEWTEKWYSNEKWLKHKIDSLYDSMKKNRSFPMTKTETNLRNFIEDNYKNVIYQYKDERYPFKCDFYIKDKDLFIEYNGHWTHGGHKFNPEDKSDIEKLERWKKKGTKYYDIAINTWTVRDPEKLRMAERNKLNYLVLWPNDTKDFNKIKPMIDSF